MKALLLTFAAAGTFLLPTISHTIMGLFSVVGFVMLGSSILRDKLARRLRSPYFVVVLLLAGPLAAQNGLQIDLAGRWHVYRGDEPRFAQPDFDDRDWRTSSLPIGSSNPFGAGGRVGWLRRRVTLPHGSDPDRLALTLGALRDGYEVYVNGQRIATTGSFESFEDAALPHPRTFPIPAGLVTAGQPLQIALRVHRKIVIPPQWRLTDNGPYLLTYQGQLPVDPGEAQFHAQYVRLSLGLVFGAVLWGMAAISFLAWLGDRRRELLWFVLVALAHGGSEFYYLSQLNPFSRPIGSSGVSGFQIALATSVWPLLGEFALAALAFPGRLWWRLAWWASFGLTLTVSWRGETAGMSGTQRFYWGTFLCGGLLIALAFVHAWRAKGQRVSWEERLVGLTLGLLGFVHAEDFLRRILGVPNLVPVSFLWGQYQVDRDQVLFTGLAALILAMLIRRLAAERREKQRLASEFEAARVVQHLLLAVPAAVPCFEVEAVYEPAQEVGGDFYWTRATPGGSLIVVVGDVSGKGLKAAMLVSVAIGILRATKSSSPTVILGAMNEGLVGHTGGGFVTCCCARFDPDATVTLANAGHPAPYGDGYEVGIDAGLPLGVALGVSYDETSIQDVLRFTLVSDGVVEAANPTGELLGSNGLARSAANPRKKSPMRPRRGARMTTSPWLRSNGRNRWYETTPAVGSFIAVCSCKCANALSIRRQPALGGSGFR